MWKSPAVPCLPFCGSRRRRAPLATCLQESGGPPRKYHQLTQTGLVVVLLYAGAKAFFRENARQIRQFSALHAA